MQDNIRCAHTCCNQITKSWHMIIAEILRTSTLRAGKYHPWQPKQTPMTVMMLFRKIVGFSFQLVTAKHTQ